MLTAAAWRGRQPPSGAAPALGWQAWRWPLGPGTWPPLAVCAGGAWGPFALAVVITALYPAVTVLLARLVLGERMRAVQQAGLALGALGIILVTA